MKSYEYRVIVDVDTADGTYPSAEKVGAEISNALVAHFAGIPFGDNEQYEAFNFSVDEQDPETSATYYEQGGDDGFDDEFDRNQNPMPPEESNDH